MEEREGEVRCLPGERYREGYMQERGEGRGRRKYVGRRRKGTVLKIWTGWRKGNEDEVGRERDERERVRKNRKGGGARWKGREQEFSHYLIQTFIYYLSLSLFV